MTDISIFEDGLDEDDLNTLAASADLTIEANKQLSNVVTDVLKDSLVANKEQELFEQKANEDIDRIFSEVMDAQTRIEAIEGNPAFVNNIMSLLGHDEFNRRVQQARLQRGDFELERLNSRISRQQSVQRRRQEARQLRLTSAATQAQTQEQETRTLSNLFQLGMSLEESERAEKRFNIFLQQSEIARTQQAISDMGRKELEAELKKKDSRFPRGMLEDRARQVETAELALESAKAQLASNRADAAAKSKAVALRNFGTETLMKMHKAAQAGGGTVSVGGVTFGIGEIVPALNQSIENDTALRGNLEENQAALIQAGADLQAAIAQTANLRNLSAGSLGADTEAKLDVAGQLVQQGIDNQAEGPVLKARTDQLNKIIDEAIEIEKQAYNTESSKNAVEAYVKGNMNPTLAGNFLANEIANPNATASGNIIFDTLGQEYQRRMDAILAEEETKSTIVTQADGSFGLASRFAERSSQRRHELVMQGSGGNEKFSVVAGVIIGNEYISDVLAELTADLDNRNPEIMANIINHETRQFNPAFLHADGSPNKDAIFSELAERTGDLQQRGLLKPGESLISITLNRMKDSKVLGAFLEKHFSNRNIFQESFVQTLYNGNPIAALNGAVNSVQNYERLSPRVIENSRLRTQVQTQGVETLTPNLRGLAHQQGSTAIREKLQQGGSEDSLIKTFENLLRQ